MGKAASTDPSKTPNLMAGGAYLPIAEKTNSLSLKWMLFLTYITLQSNKIRTRPDQLFISATSGQAKDRRSIQKENVELERINIIADSPSDLVPPIGRYNLLNSSVI